MPYVRGPQKPQKKDQQMTCETCTDTQTADDDIHPAGTTYYAYSPANDARIRVILDKPMRRSEYANNNYGASDANDKMVMWISLQDFDFDPYAESAEDATKA